MAYTYDEFVKAAGNAGVLDRFSKDDLTAAQKNPEYGLSMVGLMGDLSKATTEEQRVLATEAVNQLRKNYGVTNTEPAGSFTTVTPGSIQQTQRKQRSILDVPESFSYDVENDPVFQAYRKAYLREGDRATANALAQTSAASGGVPSSYAVTASQQAGNYYAGQLADIIPTLEQNAYQRYLNELDQDQQRFQNALTMYKTLGYATPEIREILDIPKKKKKTSSGGSYGGGTEEKTSTNTSGQTNEYVRRMQGVLLGAGYYNGPVDGIDTKLFREAMAKWNAANKTNPNEEKHSGSSGGNMTMVNR